MISAKDDAEGQEVKGCTCGLRAEWGSLDFHMCGCVRKKVGSTPTHHLQLSSGYCSCIHLFIEQIHRGCPNVPNTVLGAGYSSKLNKVHDLTEPGIYRLFSNVTSSVKPF